MNLLSQSMPLATFQLLLFDNHEGVWIESSIGPHSNRSRILLHFRDQGVQMIFCRASCGVVYVAIRGCEGHITTFNNRVVSTCVCVYSSSTFHCKSISPFSSFLHLANLVTMFMYHVEWSMLRLVFHLTWFTNVLSYFVQHMFC